MLLARAVRGRAASRARRAAEQTKVGPTLHDLTDQRQILDAVPQGVTAQDATGSLIYANEAAARAVGRLTVQELLDARPEQLDKTHEVIDESGKPLAPGTLPGVFSRGATHASDSVVGLRARDDGDETRWLRICTRPVFDADGNVRLVVSVFDDITEQRRAEQERARLLESERAARGEAEASAENLWAISSVTDVALSHLPLDEMLAELLARVRESLGADTATVLLLTRNQQHLVIRSTSGWDASSLGTLRLPVEAGFAGSVASSQRPLATQHADEAHLPSDWLRASGIVSLAGVPLLGDEGLLGVLQVGTRTTRVFDERALGLLQLVADRVSYAIERTRLFEREHRALERAEFARQRIAFLAQASEVLGTSLDYRETLARVVELAVPRIADWCVVELVEDEGDPDRLMIAATDEGRAELMRELRRRYPSTPIVPQEKNVIATGVSEVFAEITDEMRAETAVDPEHEELLNKLGLHSSMTVAIRAGNQVLGSITFASCEENRPFDPGDVPLGESLARRAAASIENARLYQEMEESRERFAYLAVTLQRSLLPQRIAEIPGVETAVRYRAAAEGTQVGGDFYDLFPIDDARWAIVMGDVCGKGARAAALTGLARHTIRSVAMLGSDPSVILDRLNDAIMREGEDDRAPQFCTVAYATLERRESSLALRVSSGGHPLPLLMHADGTVEKVGEPGLLLGVFPDAEVTEHEIALQPGDAVLFFTDGVTDSRNGADVFGEKRLSELLSKCAGSPADGIVEAVESAVTEFSSSRHSDDIAILALRVVP
jgi:PAS domain S-box-containing protein